MTAPASTRPRLLIADDDAVVRATLSAQLAREFEVVATATDTGEAVALADQHRPDAALVDVEMPGGGGLEAVRAIHALAPDTRLVILSGDDSGELVADLIGAGATAYVLKGASGREIAEALGSALKS